jgi:rSAM/selenodomain-associated transferase 1
MINQTALAIMAKQPILEKTKTRLCPFLSAREAAQLYEGLLLDTISLVNGMSASVDMAIAITPPESQAYFERIAPAGARLIPVDGADIGVCLKRTLEALIDCGYQKALALNSDSPHLPRAYLSQAIQLLDQADVVLGPSLDGGYYLVGMRQLHAGIFKGIEWSTEKVFKQTLGRAVELGLSVGLTPAWYDIDTPQDLLKLEADLQVDHRVDLPHTRAILETLDLPIRLA